MKSKLLATSCLLALFASPALAQEKSDGTGPSEIIVTAQKRAENIQNVPVAISAFTGETLNQIGVEKATDVVRQVPNVSYQAPFGDGGAPVYNIRGVSTIDFGDSNEPSVSIYADEVYIGSPAGQNGQTFDLERVEVLRGPQGTLYGRNATGGLISFVSAKPTREFEGFVRAQYGSFDQMVFEGGLSGPLGSGARARIAGKFNRDDGWQRNLVVLPGGRRFNQSKAYAVRGQLAVDLGSSGEALLNVHHSKFDGTYTGYGLFGTADPVTGATCTAAQVFAAQCVNSSGFRDPNPDPRRIYSLEPVLPSKNRNFGTSLRVNYDLGGVELVSITAYEDIRRDVTEDAAAAPVNVFPLTVNYTSQTKQFTQELRLSGQSDVLTWVVGGYYFHDSRFVTNSLPVFDLYVFGDLHTNSAALFGQASYKVSNTVSLTLGGRYTSEKRVLENLSAATGGLAGTRQGVPFFSSSGEIKANRFTGRAAIEWKPADRLMIYGSIGTGFKSGGFNSILVSSQAEVGPVRPESLTAYEVGLKSQFADRAVTFNAAAFFYDYKNIQAVGSAASAGGIPVARFINAGNARVYGADAELTLLPTRGLKISLGTGLLDTEIQTDPANTFNGRQLDGNRLLLSPTFSLKGLVRYEFSAGTTGRFAVQTDFQYQTKVFFGPDNQPTESQKAYGLVNGRLSWTSSDDRFGVELFGENLFDKKYFIYGADISGINDSLVVVWGRPRTFGVRLSAKL